TVNPKTATVTADNKGKTYGDDNPTLTATVTGTVNGDTLNYTLSTEERRVGSDGKYPITVTLGSNPNYSVTKTDGTLHIGPKTAKIGRASCRESDGDDNPTVTATVTGTVNGDTLNYTRATTALKFSSVGDYPMTVHIGPKTATVTADNKGKTYGDDNPTLTATVTGTVTGDTLHTTLATTARTYACASDHPITVTLGSNPNYSVTKTDGTLHIGPKTA